MTDFTDQQGRPLTKEQFIDQLAAAIVANVIAFAEAGAPRDAVKIIIGADGGTVMSEEAIFQTPTVRRLEQPIVRDLHAAVGRLIADYEAGRLPRVRLTELRRRHNVEHKVQALREAGIGRTA
jgi:hypothetical protein